MLHYLTFNTTSELVCLAIAGLCLFQDKNIAWRSALFYLLVVCAIELSGVYIREQGQHSSWLYNILFVFETAFFSLMFYQLLGKYFNSKPIILFGLAILFISYSIELILHGFFRRTNISLNIQGILFVLYSLFYFYCLIKDERYVNLKFSASFWWVTGVLIYYFAITVITLFYPLLAKLLVSPNESLAYTVNALNILLYGLWSYSFICRRWLITRSKI